MTNAATYQMTVLTEYASGKVDQQIITCYGPDGVAKERAHQRQMAITGSTQTITVEPMLGEPADEEE